MEYDEVVETSDADEQEAADAEASQYWRRLQSSGSGNFTVKTNSGDHSPDAPIPRALRVLASPRRLRSPSEAPERPVKRLKVPIHDMPWLSCSLTSASYRILRTAWPNTPTDTASAQG